MKFLISLYKKLKLWEVILVGVSVFLVLVGSGILWAATLEIPDLHSFESRKVQQSTKIYDRTGKILLYDMHTDQQRTIVPTTEISQNIKNATVAIEDQNFYQHHGIQVTSIIRSFLADVTSLGYAQGGSTITQQVVKLSLLTSDKSISRKIKEWILALKLDNTLTKDEILEVYLNEAPYGGSLYGVEEASEAFFGKHASELDIAESAYVASIPQAPSYFSPWGNNMSALSDRKNLVLSKMHDLKYINDADYATAKAEKVTFNPQQVSSIIAPHFVFYVRDQLVAKYGETALEENGYRVITTLDVGLQQKAEAIAKKYALANAKTFNASNAAMVALDPRNGEILTMVGSRDYFDTQIQGNFNVALAPRQPGSSFKPFVYAKAFEDGYTPDTVVFDLKTQFSTNCDAKNLSSTPPCYAPQNYDGDFLGPITFRNALAQSRNIPAVKVLYLVGIQNALDTARDMGISTLGSALQYGLTLVLGGGEVTLLDMSSAYGVFANEGNRVDPTPILRVEDESGNVIDQHQVESTPAITEQAALQIDDVLSDNVARTPEFGVDSPLNFPNHDVAVKTGTTNNYKDAWIVGYTPNVVVGAWAGNNDNSPMAKKIAGFIVAPMWNAFMQQVIASRDVEQFPTPDPTPPDVKPVLRGHWEGNDSYFVDSVTGLLATQFTPDASKVEKFIPNVHDILYWVNKTDPRGPIPTNPQSDPQFDHREYPVSLWKAQQGIVDGNRNGIPTQTDTVHTATSQPTISLTFPLQNAALPLSQPLTITPTFTGQFQPKSVDYFLNDSKIGTVTQAPFTLTVNPTDTGASAGQTSIRAVVTDTALQTANVTVFVNFVDTGANPTTGTSTPAP